jgi:hypothetical protein
MRKLRNKKTLATILAAAERAEIGYLRIDENGPYMPLSAEVIANTTSGKLLAVSHTYTQNGDLMRDPEVVFLCGNDGSFYPVEFRNDGIGTHNNAANWKDGKLESYRPRMQADITAFAAIFVRNLREQGFEKLAASAK